MAEHTAQHSHAAIDHHDTHHDTHDDTHIIPVSLYLKIFAWLMFLLILTLGVAMFDLPGPLNIIVAMTVAIVKAVLIILYFMHVRFSSRLTWLFAGAGFAWLLIMFSLTFSDYMSRGWLPNPGNIVR